MATVCPAILAADTEEYRTQVEKVAPFATRLHIDLTDAEFAPTKTISLQTVWWPHVVRADLHLMYRRPDKYLDEILELSPNMVIVHAEAEIDHSAFIKTMRQNNIKVGLALLSTTSVDSVASLLKDIDHVMIFSGDLGHFGGQVDLNLLAKAKQAKAVNSSLEIGWDGGVSDQNIKSLNDGGIEVFDVGGFIQKSTDPTQAYAKLNEVLSYEK